MRIVAPILVVSALLATPVAAEEVRSFERAFDAASLSELAVDFPIGELTVVGTSDSRIEVNVSVRCSDGWRYEACVGRAERVSLESESSSQTLSLWFDGYSSWRNRGMNLDVTVRVPARLALSVDMNIGELDIEDMAGDVTVDMSIGEVSVSMAQSAVRDVRMDTGIGETSLRTTERRSGSAGLFTREVRWDSGAGEATVRIDLGIGEVDVRLR